MSFRQSRKYKSLLWLLTAVCVGGAGFIAYKVFFDTVSTAKELKAAEDAYARGLAAYNDKNWADAVVRFDEARLLSQKALVSLDAEIKNEKVPEDQARSIVGRVSWLKARAIRDHAFAKAQADGKGIPETTDAQYKETFRALLLIPDADARNEAFNSLRIATSLMGADPQTPKDLFRDVLKEALRVELVLPIIQWKVAEPLLRKSLELNPNDARSHYFLARFEYDQPDDNSLPTDVKKKTSERVNRATEHLAAAKKNGAQFWRTAGLEAEILDWPVVTGAARKLKPEAIASAEKALDDLLFTSPTGLIEVAARGENLTNLGRADALGMSRTLLVGIDRALADARKPGGSPDRVRAVARAATELADKLDAEPATKPFVPDVLFAVLQVSIAAQPVLVKADPVGWREHAARIDALVEKSADSIRGRPAINKQLAQLATLNAFQAARAKDPVAAKQLLAKALQITEEGLKAAEEAKLPAAEIDEYHALVAERKLRAGAKVEDIEPHLARLRVSAVPVQKQWGQFLDAAVAERQGKMEKARKLLQTLTADRNNADINVRDRAFQATVLLFRASKATGDEVAALAALGEIDAKYASEQVSPAARAFADENIGGPDAVTALRVIGNLAVALQAAVRFTKDNPGKPVPGDLVAGNETAADTLMKKLRPPSTGDRTARLAFANFYRATNRRNLTETRLAELATDYPDSVDVLRARCTLLAAPKDVTATVISEDGVAAADGLIRAFIKAYPGDRAGPLFNAEWLILTNRAAAAADYLKDAANFPGGRDPVIDRILAAALFRSGQRDEAQKILTRLPSDPTTDAILIQAATTREAGEKQLKDALGRQYDDPGLFRVYEAALRLSEGKYEEAIREFASAVEFTRVGAAAKAGLQRALVDYAGVEPAKARDAAVKLTVEMPDEPGLYLAAADAALILDEIGEPADTWEQTKTAWAAMNRWETVAQKAGTPRPDIALAKTYFQLLAGNPDGAKREAANGLTRDPKHVPIMLALADLSLAPPAYTARARELYDAAVKENPADPRLPYLDARIKTATNDWAGAAAVYERLVGETPRNAGPYALLVGASEGAGKKEVALKWARAWQAKLPDDPQAATTVVRLLAVADKADAIKAADTFVARQVAEARKRTAELNPPIPQADADKASDRARGTALLVVASGFFRAQVLDEAAARALEAGKYLHGDERVALMLGDVAILRKDWDTALDIYRALLKQNPRHFIAGNNLAWILAEHQNNPSAALTVVEDVRKGRNGVRPIGAERLPADFLDTIGVVYMKLNQPGKFKEMQALFEVAVKRHPIDPRMYLYLGQAQAENGEKSKAIESLDTATRLAGVKNALPEEQNKGVINAAETTRKRIRG